MSAGRGRRGLGGRDVLVGEGELGEGGAQVPGEVAGEHADQDVAADSLFQVVVDGPQVQVVVFGDAEVPLDVLEVLAGGDQAGRAEDFLFHACADDVDPVERCLSRDLLGVAPESETGIGDLRGEVLGDLVLAGDLPGPLPDLPGALAAGAGRRSGCR